MDYGIVITERVLPAAGVVPLVIDEVPAHVIFVAAMFRHGKKTDLRHYSDQAEEFRCFLGLQECVLLRYFEFGEALRSWVGSGYSNAERREAFPDDRQPVIHVAAKDVIEEINDAGLIRAGRVGCRDDSSRNCRELPCFAIGQDGKCSALIAGAAGSLGDCSKRTAGKA